MDVTLVEETTVSMLNSRIMDRTLPSTWRLPHSVCHSGGILRLSQWIDRVFLPEYLLLYLLILLIITALDYDTLLLVELLLGLLVDLSKLLGHVCKVHALCAVAGESCPELGDFNQDLGGL